jgi:hypothetical protein
MGIILLALRNSVNLPRDPMKLAEAIKWAESPLAESTSEMAR